MGAENEADEWRQMAAALRQHQFYPEALRAAEHAVERSEVDTGAWSERGDKGKETGRSLPDVGES